MRPTAKAKPKVSALPGATPSAPSRQGRATPTITAPLTPGPATAFSAAQVSASQRPSRDFGGGSVGADAPLPPAKPPPLRTQIEAYFSDEGLGQDRYLHDLVTQSPGGWVDISVVLGLRKVKALKAKREDVLRCLHGSWLEICEDKESGTAAVRRPKNLPVKKESAPPKFGVQNPQQPTQAPPLRGKAGKQQPQPSANGGKGKQLFPGRLTGAISDYDEETGNASISCSQTEVLFHRDVIIDWRELERAAISVTIGSLVSFLVELAPDGTPQARDVKLRVPEDGDEAAAATRAAVVAARRARQKTATKPKVGNPGAKAVVGQRYSGVIKSFHEGLGVGFVSCKETFATYGRDVSISTAECAGFAPGDAVTFELAVDATLGTPKAKDLEAAEPEEPEDLAAAGQEEEEEENVDDGEDNQAPVSAPQAQKRKAAMPAERRHTGVVKSFNPALGVGRIACDSFAQLLTVEEAELAGFCVGDAVSFKIIADELGKRKASELEAE